MNAELAHELERRRASRARTRSGRARIIGGLGPLTVLAGLVWAFVQPYRLTFLHPHDQGFWWLLSEPPIYVVLVGILFWRVIAPGLLEDLEAEAGK
ncbi:MAG: hypothetical protein E6G08_18810 [Actinobacteria bacterium]|nr:MAG: hypothetical protein E6G08_18810 [Actinomycetota bacterium]